MPYLVACGKFLIRLDLQNTPLQRHVTSMVHGIVQVVLQHPTWIIFYVKVPDLQLLPALVGDEGVSRGGRVVVGHARSGHWHLA